MESAHVQIKFTYACVVELKFENLQFQRWYPAVGTCQINSPVPAGQTYVRQGLTPRHVPVMYS